MDNNSEGAFTVSGGVYVEGEVTGRPVFRRLEFGDEGGGGSRNGASVDGIKGEDDSVDDRLDGIGGIAGGWDVSEVGL